MQRSILPKYFEAVQRLLHAALVASYRMVHVCGNFGGVLVNVQR
jgi:hypothetical protein